MTLEQTAGITALEPKYKFFCDECGECTGSVDYPEEQTTIFVTTPIFDHDKHFCSAQCLHTFAENYLEVEAEQPKGLQHP